MAFVQIKDATVTRVNRAGFGVQVKEPDRESGGKTFKGDRFTVWFTAPHGLTEGDMVSVSGFLAAKMGEPWTDREGNERRSVELSVNSPRVEGWPSKPVEPVGEPF
jgi:hypothetical protein